MACSRAGQTGRSLYIPPDLQDGTLDIEVKYAKNLKNTDLFTNSDPYCTIDIEGKTFATDVLWGKGKNPIWNYSTGPVEIMSTTDVVRFAIKDKDRFGEDDIMGYATLPLDEVRRQGFLSIELPVKRPSGKNKGTLAVNARYTRPQPTLAESLESLDLDAPLPPPRRFAGPASTRPGSQYLKHTANNLSHTFDSLGLDPDEVMLRESRQVQSQFEAELKEVQNKVESLKQERNKLLLSADPGVSVVEHMMAHTDEFMAIDDQLKTNLKKQETLRYGIRELIGMEQLVKEHQLVEPEVVQPMQQFILLGVKNEVDRLAEEATASGPPPESIVQQVKRQVGAWKPQLDTSDSLKRIDMWKSMVDELFLQREAAQVAASAGPAQDAVHTRSGLWGSAIKKIPLPPPPPTQPALSDPNLIQNLESILNALSGRPGSRLPDSVAALSAPPPVYTPPPGTLPYDDDDDDEPPSPPPPPPDDDDEPPPPPPPPGGYPEYGYQTMVPPPPPPPPGGRNPVTLEGENVGPRAPPPPPVWQPGTKRPANNTTGVQRTAEVSALLGELKNAVMGGGPKKTVAVGGAKKSDLIAELEQKSGFIQEVKAEVQQYGYLMEQLGKEINDFTCNDMESAGLFMRRIDKELSVMKHEVEVMNHYSSVFPTQRYWTIREAAYLYTDLQAFRHKIRHWETNPNNRTESIGRIDQFYNKLVWQIDKLLQSQEEMVKRFKSEGLPWDNVYVQRVQHDALKLVSLYMELTLQEVDSLESQLPPSPELTDKCFKLVSAAAQFAVKGHQFAGGLDPGTSETFQNLASVARKYAQLKAKETQAAQ